MLVLSRKNKEVIRFPEVGISVEILRIKGSTVRVGIDAPMEISVVRGELGDDAARQTIKKISIPQTDEHKFRNQLNSLAIASALTRKLMQAGRTGEACTELENALSRLEQLGSESHPAPLTALLVEDTANEREMLAGFLRLHGYQVKTVNDGLEAIKYLEQNPVRPDLILMDMNMPNCDGPTTIRRIRENAAWDNILIFAVSGLLPQDVGIDAKRERVTRWFQKPLEPADLIMAINKLVPCTAA